MTNSNILIVNNSGSDIKIIRQHLIDFAKTGELNEDLVDIFSVYKVSESGQTKVIVDFLDY